MSGRRAYYGGGESSRSLGADSKRGSLAEGGEESDRGRAITGEGVSRLNQAQKRAKERPSPRMSHCNLQISRMFSGIAAARTNCDYLAEIKNPRAWIHRARLVPIAPSIPPYIRIYTSI